MCFQHENPNLFFFFYFTEKESTAIETYLFINTMKCE